MSRPVIVGIDPVGDDPAPARFGAAAARATNSRLLVLAVGPGRVGSKLLDRVRQEMERDGVAAEYRWLTGQSAAHALHDAAEEHDAGLLVVGSAERRLPAGSVAERLFHGAPRPVGMVPRGWTAGRGLRTVGVAFVHTPEGRHALRAATALARASGARLRVITVAPPPTSRPGTTHELNGNDRRPIAERLVRAAVAGIEDVDVDLYMSVGDPVELLVSASRRLDVLICGSHGYGPPGAVLLGGVSRRLAAAAGCPLVVLARGLPWLVDDTTTRHSRSAMTPST